MPRHVPETRAKPGGLFRGALIAGLLLALAGPGQAATEARRWQVAVTESAITFHYLSNGQPDQGTFARFSGSARFDPHALDDTALELRITSASIDLGDPQTSAFATSAEWFDSANHPDIVYRLISLTQETGDSYLARGALTIRGRTLPITTTIRLTIDGTEAHASGTLKIDRSDYGLGYGPMSLFVSIGSEVDVSFDLTAHPLAP